ncbi:GNAT family N-acetyltransferase [Pseudalkalibacillus sp. A8]|uniref:GNAT family N-acetyltransferase n=1 Tax=Pseudalkalibacillus sp. A8 TaxID=3382641 RepID=UPI0038B4FFD6
MTQTVDQIKIVEYEPSYAAAVAEMWNHSQDGWGGGNTVKTEEQILKEEANSTNLHLYLALEGEKVVGYCSLGEYREDEGALYIPLLNVRSDYHGKKIGKKLVLKALERVIELKWPRLDLYTWPGNTKAVPLYKKCGFFWEERDDATHLMNFMPTVLHTEAVQEYFKDLNWYEASTRLIEVKPDGITENDFHYYEYSWDKRGEMLKMQFERFGRGLRSIETDDYKISATVEDFKLVFGSQYIVRYHISNKTGNPLTISLRGNENKNIHFSFEKDYITVKDEDVIEAPFFVDRIKEEQSVWRTHPTVDTDVLINGKMAKFQVGVLPKFPANVSCHTPRNLSFIGQSSNLYVDIENNYKETVKFSFVLPGSELFSPMQSEVDVSLPPKSRCSVPIEYA